MVNPIRDFHLVVPMVLGMISAKTRISMVVIALTRPNQALPKSRVACWPTPAAPMVLAMVLRLSIAAIGREDSCLYCLNRLAGL